MKWMFLLFVCLSLLANAGSYQPGFILNKSLTPAYNQPPILASNQSPIFAHNQSPILAYNQNPISAFIQSLSAGCDQPTQPYTQQTPGFSQSTLNHNDSSIPNYNESSIPNYNKSSIPDYNKSSIATFNLTANSNHIQASILSYNQQSILNNNQPSSNNNHSKQQRLQQSDPPYDLVISGGKILDGTGNSWFYGDIAIRDGKIAAIGKLSNSVATRTIRADGLVIAPGFIDVHAHLEGSIFEKPTADNFIFDGVTTLITGNCGGSYSGGIGKFLAKLDSAGTSVNIASLVGHNTIREAIMKRAYRDPTGEEQRSMDSLTAVAMEEGAVGLSTGLIYIPGTYSKTSEIKSLATVVARYNGVYASHMRNEGKNVVDAINETIDIGRSAGVPVQISHFKVTGKNNWGNSQNTIELIRAARKEGLDVTIDQYPYTASSTNLHVILPSWVMSGGQDSVLFRLSDNAIREKIIEEIVAESKRDKRKNFSYAVVANCGADSTLNGKSISDITRERGKKPTVRNDINTVFSVIRKGGAQMIYHSMSEKDVAYIMQYPFNMVASDAGVVYLPKSVPHPRAYGTNARVLASYVREKNVISLEEAVRRMTSLPAQKFRLSDRGLLKPGMVADIVVFDPATIQDRSTFENPHALTTGFRFVIVNGVLTLEEGVHTGARNGKALRQKL